MLPAINIRLALTKLAKATLFTSTRVYNEEAAAENEKPIDPSKDRRNPVSAETSIRYLDSQAFKETYKGHLVWELYRRNFKGQFPPHKTRKTCIRGGVIATGNPCPICRDEYLVLDYRNIKLLQQFISPYNGETLSFKKTNVCQKQHQNLLVAILKAKDHGLITFDVPFRTYDYSLYNGELEEAHQ